MRKGDMMRKNERYAPASMWGLLVLLSLTLFSQACNTPREGEASVVDESQQADAAEMNDAGAQDPSRLAVLWTSGDREVALKVAFMYTLNAKRQGWFDEVTLIVWGPSAKLLSEDAELQQQIQGMAEVGVEIVACKACADQYGVADALSGMGIDVKYMGRPLTDILQADWKVITF